MTQAQVVADLTSDVAVIAFLASLAFIIAYTALARWWRSGIGRALVMLDAGLALTLAPAVLHRVLGLTVTASAGFAWYFLGSLTLVATAVTWRTVIMVGEQLRHRRSASSGQPKH